MQNTKSPKGKQRHFQELVSSGSYAPNYPPIDSWDLEPPTASSQQPRLPKSETMSDYRDPREVPCPKNRRLASSLSQNNFRGLRDRLSTSGLFKGVPNANYVALSNSSESVPDSECGDLTPLSPSGKSVPTGPDDTSLRTTRSVYAFISNSEGGRNGAAIARLGGRSLLSVPNFQRIRAQELKGLMEDTSDSSAADPTQGHELKVRDSLESIPDIKDFISPDIGPEKPFPDDSGSLKLIDLEADCTESGVAVSWLDGIEDGGCEVWQVKNGKSHVSQYFGHHIPKSLSCAEEPLPALAEHAPWDSHKDYASCLNMTATTPDARRSSAFLELKTFPGLADCDEGISEDMLCEDGDVDVGNGNNDPDTSPVRIESENGTIGYKSPAHVKDGACSQGPRHFSMLVLGGRELGLNGCGRRPITIWKLDFWK